VIARVKFDYAARTKIAELYKDEFAKPAIDAIFGDDVPKPEYQTVDYMWPETMLVDLDTDGKVLSSYGVEYIIKSYKGCLPLKAILPEGGDYTVYVQIPHIGLLSIDEVQVIEDACTDHLQRELNSGWRILCVCPPNAARRPDYILGRTKGNER
jgi:hypothetical protein